MGCTHSHPSELAENALQPPNDHTTMSNILLSNLDLLQEVASFLSLEELHKNRLVCLAFQYICDRDNRWIPIIAPPHLAHQVLDLANKEHYKELRRCYFLFLQWSKVWANIYEFGDWQQLWRKQSHLDGFFSLSPWNTAAGSYPTPWLHRMVYEQMCPTELNSAARAQTHGFNPFDASLFFHQRVRSFVDMFRVFISTPIKPAGIPKEKLRRVVIQPVNFRTFSGAKHPKFAGSQERNYGWIEGH